MEDRHCLLYLGDECLPPRYLSLEHASNVWTIVCSWRKDVKTPHNTPYTVYVATLSFLNMARLLHVVPHSNDKFDLPFTDNVHLSMSTTSIGELMDGCSFYISRHNCLIRSISSMMCKITIVKCDSSRHHGHPRWPPKWWLAMIWLVGWLANRLEVSSLGERAREWAVEQAERHSLAFQHLWYEVAISKEGILHLAE